MRSKQIADGSDFYVQHVERSDAPLESGSVGRLPGTDREAALALAAKALPGRCPKLQTVGDLEATPGIEPGYADLQSAASPLRHVASRSN